MQPLKLLNTTRLGPKEIAFKRREAQRQIEAQVGHYWPEEALPFIYALDCVKIVLLRSEKASHIYQRIIQALKLPGCQSLLAEFKIHIPKALEWQQAIFRACENKAPCPEWPSVVFTMCEQHKNNQDYQDFIKHLGEFILVGFNRQTDQGEKRWKVLPGTSLALIFAIVCRALVEYCKAEIEDWHKYRPDHIEEIMTGNPTTRQERQLKHQMLQDFKNRYKWMLHHDSKSLRDADQWYRCRVDPGTIEQYISDECEKINRQANDLSNEELERHYSLSKTNRRIDPYPERSNIETALAPYDAAVGYPRKWRN